MRAAIGLTVIELLATLMLLAVLAGVGVPGFTRWRLDAEMTAQVNAFIHGIYMAKHAAHQRQVPVVLCKSASGRRCSHDNDWHGGWLVFANTDRDMPPEIDPDEPVLLSRPRYRGGEIYGNRDSFVFRPFEIRSTNGTLLFCDRRGMEAARLVIVSYTGRPRAARPAHGHDKTQLCVN